MSNRKHARVGDTIAVAGDAWEFNPNTGVVTHVFSGGDAIFTSDDDGGSYSVQPDDYTVVKRAVVSDEVTHPSHYQHPSGIEVIEITKHESFLRGNIIKYVLRAPSKGTELLDLKKARQYLDWEIERVEAINNGS